ncbi:hypothetical protein AQ490_11620 [Wenjunlia vitaminophila]|uniref:Peptidase inhibitor family I36 n=1 Tax=Wenjunlia vitaminophila TaxID=76728 RepID=A0A0T6LKW5_WENVI|nr:peptidase inhibitor family I36 protein [Wenjunlia vitaminophila]KRV46529.1 hypothetical protein AQ490_11620 [Wenjunlia vitaminophila]
MRAITLAVAGILVAAVPTTAAGHAGPPTAASAGAPITARAVDGCDRGEFCVWTGARHTGRRHTWNLAGAGVQSCVPLPSGDVGRSFANRMSRPVTVYEDRECATEGQFDTYPGGGTWVPEAPFVVRALQVWES